MEMNPIEQLNQSAMNIILYAGNARDYYNEALDYAETGDMESCERFIKNAEAELVNAHKIQTRLIQDAIEEESPNMTVLFIHAQDTLMTVNSELLLVKRMLKLYKRIHAGEVKV